MRLALILRRLQGSAYGKQRNTAPKNGEVKRCKQAALNIQNWSTIVLQNLHTWELDRMAMVEQLDHIKINECAVTDGRKHRDMKAMSHNVVGGVAHGINASHVKFGLNPKDFLFVENTGIYSQNPREDSIGCRTLDVLLLNDSGDCCTVRFQLGNELAEKVESFYHIVVDKGILEKLMQQLKTRI